jgi:acyl-CoA reductase-like NAD-dependent aldehyde dehydrogenase
MSTTTKSYELTAEKVQSILKKQRAYFASGATKSVEFRKEQLQKLKELIQNNEDAILEALHKDLHKHEFEAYTTEIGFVINDIDKSLNKINKWAKPQKVGTPPFLAIGHSHIQSEPYGTVLIIAPWNYPMQLMLAPLVGAIAAGNTAIVKPSEMAPHTSALLTRLVNSTFDGRYIQVVEGAVRETQLLLDEKFDFIFFTGSTKVGKIIYQAAAKHLTPVALELGGKSPCIVDTDIQLDYTAKRIVWGKFINAGQTCIAPDYLLVDQRIKDALVEKMVYYIGEFFGEDPQQSDSLARIINHDHFERLKGYLQQGKIITGGQSDKADKYIAPTLMEDVGLESDIMQEEIFGPILPIITYGNLREAIDLIKERPKPLALYMFSKNDKKIETVMEQTSAGGVTINDTLMHIVNSNLPFGGVGDSGIGAYHGRHSFELFSHQKSILHRSFMIEEPIRYAPFKLKLSWIKKLMKWSL